MTPEVSRKSRRKSTTHPFARPFSQKRIESISEEDRKGRIVPHHVSNCREKQTKEAEAQTFLESQRIPVVEMTPSSFRFSRARADRARE